jgi:RNA polymerase sigma-B factor
MSDQATASFEVDGLSGRYLRGHVLDALPSLPPRRRAEIELAVAELAGHLIESGASSAQVSIVADTRSVVVDVHAEDDITGAPVDPMRARVLEVVSDSWWSAGSDAGARLLLRPTSTLTLEDASERELFQRLDRDDDARDILFEKYSYLADRISRRFRGKGIAQDDVEQVARFALVKAMGRFDVDHGASFASFAARTISGELKRLLRDKAWSVRVPRGLQEAVLAVNGSSSRLQQKLGKVPTVADIAADLDLAEDEVIEAMTAGSSYRSASLDAPVGAEDDRTHKDSLGDVDLRMALAAEWSDLQDAIADLDDRDVEILYLRFYEDLTQTEIAEQIGVSQMHVSRLIRSALGTLRDRLE